MTKDEWYKQLFERLGNSRFRSRFHLKQNDIDYIHEKGLDTIRKHAEDFITKREAPAYIPNDGKQEVLHADWQEVWHSPHPPFFTVFCKFFVFRVLICSITLSSLCNYILGIVYHISSHFKSFFLRQHSTQCSTACAHKKCCNCMSCTHIPAAFCHNRDSQQ